jgi:hypothetical protein
MEAYQTVAIVLAIIMLLIGIAVMALVPFPFGMLGGWIAFCSFVCIFVPLANPEKHSKAVGVTLLIFGIIGTWLLIIPAIMALIYKPKSQFGGIRQ